MKELTGLKIKKVLMEKGESRIVFVTDKRNIGYSTYGDCCSETWFADIIGTDALIDGTVSSVENIVVADKDDGRSRQEHDDFMGIKITTDKGSCEIIYRNSSNGYYGGDITSAEVGCSEPDDYASITEDWSA